MLEQRRLKILQGSFVDVAEYNFGHGFGRYGPGCYGYGYWGDGIGDGIGYYGDGHCSNGYGAISDNGFEESVSE